MNQIEQNYFKHLNNISLLGRIYKKYISSPIIMNRASMFGSTFLEVGAGIGSGVLGAYPTKTVGLDINVEAIEFCRKNGLISDLIDTDGKFPCKNEQFDCCILDNVLEHISEPKSTLDECYRVTRQNGGLIIVVPGEKGFLSDNDHKINYKAENLRKLDDNWELLTLFSMPFFFQNRALSSMLRQYSLIATYRKR